MERISVRDCLMVSVSETTWAWPGASPREWTWWGWHHPPLTLAGLGAASQPGACEGLTGALLRGTPHSSPPRSGPLRCSQLVLGWSPKGGQHSNLSLGMSLMTLGMTSIPTITTRYLHGSIPFCPATSSPCWQRQDTSPLTGRLPFQGLGLTRKEHRGSRNHFI